MDHTKLVFWAHEVARRSETPIYAKFLFLLILGMLLELKKLSERMFVNLVTAKPEFTTMTPDDYVIVNWFAEVDVDNNGWITLEDHEVAMEKERSREKADKKAPKWLEEQELELEFEGEIHYLREYIMSNILLILYVIRNAICRISLPVDV
jgi:hypothetical protein